MNFLGIGPGEIFLILILLLVVVGPERLPEFARAAGRFVVRVRGWIASSPDAQMVMRAREELENELQELRRSLTEEVETVRKELETVRGDLAEATKLVEESAEEVARTRVDLDPAADTPAARTIAPPQPAQPAAESPAQEVGAGPTGQPPQAAAEQTGAAPAELLPASPPEAAVNGQAVARSFKPGQQPPRPEPPAVEQTAIDELSRRILALNDEFGRQIQALSAELQSLRERQAQPAASAAALDLSAPLTPDEPAAPVAVDAARLDTRRRCKGVTRSGEPCAAPPLKGQDYCRAHAGQRVLEEVS